MIRYTSDLTEEQFEKIAVYLPKVKTTKPRKWSRHEIFNSILYIDVAGCQRRNLPKDLPPWKTVYHYFRLWKKDGTYDRMMTGLHKDVRISTGKKRATYSMTHGFTSRKKHR